MKPSTQTTTFTQDNMGRIVTQSDDVGTISFGYDDGDNPLTITEGSAVLTRTFDNMDRVETYTDAAGNTIEYEWDKNGRLTKITYPYEREVSYTYDAHNRLKTVTDWANRVTTYHWDAAGRLIGVDRPNGTTRTNEYTLGDELERYYERNGAGILQAYARFGYDLDSRIDWRYRLPKPQEMTLPSFTATHDADNRVATWNSEAVTHDNDGNMTFGPLPIESSFVSYNFDARNRLTGVGGVTYTYDSENNRIAKTTADGTTSYVFDPHGDALPRVLVRERPDESLTFYVYGIGLLYEVDEAENATYYHFDQSGSTIALTNDAGEVTDRVEYTPYGTISHRTGETDTPFLYAGQFGIQADPNGLLHMRARYYSPELKRFINADPAGFDGGMNWYAYANNSPLMYVDADGEHPILVLALVGGVSNVAVGMGIAAVTGQDYTMRDAATDFAIGALFGGASGATINSARFYRAARFTASSRSWNWGNVSRALKRPKWDFAQPNQQIHHWAIPQSGWGRHVPNRIKNSPWNLMPARSNVWHQSVHGKKPVPYNLGQRLWHGSPAWAKPAVVGTGVSIGNHSSRSMTNWSGGNSSSHLSTPSFNSGFGNVGSSGGSGWK